MERVPVVLPVLLVAVLVPCLGGEEVAHESRRWASHSGHAGLVQAGTDHKLRLDHLPDEGSSSRAGVVRFSGGLLENGARFEVFVCFGNCPLSR